MSLYKHLTRIYTVFNNFTVHPLWCPTAHVADRLCSVATVNASRFHSSSKRYGWQEFFDQEANFNEKEIRTGRSWKTDELRIKSNSDLHKLWYVLLKEKNMLLTMEHEYKSLELSMPSPERIDKVEESMRNLETVVRERNRAYYELETGETGERKVVIDENCFGLPCNRKLTEHYIEKKFNRSFRKKYNLNYRIMNYKDVELFLRKYNEKKKNKEFWRAKMRYRHVCGLLRRFSDIDEESLKHEFPDVDIEEAKMDKMSRGPRVNPF